MKRFALLVLLTIQLYASAQQKVITGKVVSADQEVLIGVNVFLKSDWQIGGSTDIDGIFEFEVEKPAHNDSMVISYIGYKELFVPINGQIPSKFELKPISTKIEEVVIRAERMIAEEFSIKKIRKLDIYLNPSAKADPLLAVNSMPAATTTDESANISFRGNSPALTGIYLNNVPIYDAVRFSQLNGIGTFSLFNTSIIKDVQVHAGNPPIEYGNIASGLIALTTTDNQPKAKTQSVSISPASFGGTLSIPINDKSSLMAFGNYQPSSIIKAINKKSLEDIIDFHSLDAGIHYFRKVNNGHLKVFNYSVLENYTYAFSHPTYQGDFQQTKKRNFTIGSFRKLIDDHNELTVNGAYSKSKSEYSFSKSHYLFYNRDVFGSVNHMVSVNKSTLKYGISYDHRKVDANYTYAQYGFALGEQHPTSTFDQRLSLNIFESYLYAKQELSDRFIIGIGLRKNIPVDTVSSYWSGQLNTHIKIGTSQKLNLGIGQYNKYHFGQGTGSITHFANRQITADYSLEHRSVTYQVSLYHQQDINDIINTNGLEIFIEGRPIKNLNVQTSLSYLEKTAKDSDTIIDKFPNYFIKGMISYKLPRQWTFNSTFVWRDGTFYSDINSVSFRPDLDAFEPTYSNTTHSQFEDYQSIDLNISKLIPSGERTTIIMFASLSNIMNTKNARSVEYNSDYSSSSTNLFSLRTFYAGVVVNW